MNEAAGGHARILIVEDSPTQALQLAEILEENGYRTAKAMNGEEALAAVKEAAPDLVVSDVLMPVMDGYRMCRALKAQPETRDIPVILLTKLSEPEDIIKGLECGADNFVIKPYETETLLTRVRRTLDLRGPREGRDAADGLEFHFRGKSYTLGSDRMRMLDILLSAYETVLEQKKELLRKNTELESAASMIRTLEGMLPVCTGCRKIRDENGKWQHMETYITKHSGAEFSHGLCPDCLKRLYPEYS